MSVQGLEPQQCVLEKKLLQMPVKGTLSVLHYMAEQFAVNITWYYYRYVKKII